jgi:hypothetical protein
VVVTYVFSNKLERLDLDMTGVRYGKTMDIEIQQDRHVFQNAQGNKFAIM